jgi:hypothetical protein
VKKHKRLTKLQNPRDKALLHFVEVTVPPKKNATEGRRVFCVHCTRDMRIWWESHPLKIKTATFFVLFTSLMGSFLIKDYSLS